MRAHGARPPGGANGAPQWKSVVETGEQAMTIPTIGLRALPLWAAIVPLATVNLCYVVAAGLEHVPACIPYFSGCTSVSSTGRIAPERFIFLAGMLPSVVIVAFFWQRSALFLKLGGQTGAPVVTLRVLGIIAALSLLSYALTLGSEAEGYRQLRRAGINGFAVSTFLAQVLLIFFYRSMRLPATEILWRWLVGLCLALPLLGIAAEVAKFAGAPRHAANNIVAWNAFVVASAYYAVVARVWWHHGYPGNFDSTSGGRPASPSE